MVKLWKFGARQVRKPKLEQLETRTLFAAVSGAVWIDLNGNSEVDSTDEAVESALVWIDTNRNGRPDAGEPQTRSAADGGYSFSGLAAGDYEIRMHPTPGLFQTSPSQYFAFYRDINTNLAGLAEIDVDTGSVTHLTPAVGVGRQALIKTIQGEFYASEFLGGTIHRIEPVTGAQTLVGTTGKELVAGLAYDATMDKIYTLARETGASASPWLLYEVNRQTGALTRVGTGGGITGIVATSSMTFDSVNRQVVLFDNNLDEVIAYDLNGTGRKLSRFSSAVGFYNLAFDGHRFVTFESGSQATSVYELDIHQAKLTPVRSLDKPLLVGAADMLAASEPHRVRLADQAAVEAGLSFLTNRIHITQATLELNNSSFRLSSIEKRLDIETPLDDETLPLRFCVGSLASNLTVEQSLAVAKSIEIKMSPLDDQLSIDAAPLVSIRMGAGRDTLVPMGPMQLKLPELKNTVSGVDVIDLSGSGAVTLVADSASVRAVSDAKKLTVVASAEDEVDLSSESWNALAPVAAGTRRLHELSLADVILELDNGLGWHNPLKALDVNRDGSISPIDALLIINVLNQAGSRPLSATDSTVAQAEYVDTSSDNFVSPIDALLIINDINSRS